MIIRSLLDQKQCRHRIMSVFGRSGSSGAVTRMSRSQTAMVMLLMATMLFVSVRLYVYLTKEEFSFTEAAATAMSWEGFGPEKGVYNFTVVTAMLDIGRGNWTTQSRTYNTYLLFMQHMLRLDVNLVVFVNPAGRPFIEWMRRGRERRTKIVEMELSDLPDYQHKKRVADIMASESYRSDNQLVKNKLCESYIPEYDIIQWSKLYFMNRTIGQDPFNSDLFMWLDGGYAHGEAGVYTQADGVWEPSDAILKHLHQVTFIEREPVEKFRKDIARLHKISINIIAGLFFAGGKRAFRRLYELQRELIADWLKVGIVDDDQTTYMLMYYKEPELFNLVRGDWNDVFKLFNKRHPLYTDSTNKPNR